jgi:hypothetical protein
MTTPWYSEALLTERLALSRNVLEHFRSKSLKKTDWKKEGRAILISQSALDQLLRKLGSPDLDCSSCLEKNGAAPLADEPIDLVVVRIFPNPHILQAKKPESEELVRVRVPNNANFRPLMKFKARPDPNAEGLYKLEGRTPRFPGRW